nr:unnamed protein product [Callosobruchus chinensis]
MVLLLLGNHASHTAVKNINVCEENGIVLLTLPPHCTHKLQPMDRATFGPSEKAVNTTCKSWMRLQNNSSRAWSRTGSNRLYYILEVVFVVGLLFPSVF